MEGTEKIYCPMPTDNSQLLAELINANGKGDANYNQMWNNPFAYLIWMMFANRFGYGNGDATQGAELMGKLNEISSVLNNNQNTNLMMDAINGNHEAMHEIQTKLGIDSATMQGLVSGLRSSIAEVGGQVGITGLQVINGSLLGNKDLIAAIKDCCCNTQQSILKMGYENQINTMNQTNQLQERLTGISNGIQLGFSSTAYETQRQTCDIINSGNANTQRIIDTLNTHWHSETAQALAEAKLELSQVKQNQYLISQLKTA